MDWNPATKHICLSAERWSLLWDFEKKEKFFLSKVNPLVIGITWSLGELWQSIIFALKLSTTFSLKNFSLHSRNIFKFSSCVTSSPPFTSACLPMPFLHSRVSKKKSERKRRHSTLYLLFTWHSLHWRYHLLTPTHYPLQITYVWSLQWSPNNIQYILSKAIILLDFSARLHIDFVL